MNIAIVGGGICGLSLAMNLHRHGIACRVYERAPEIKELGVGITVLPHAFREFEALGVGAEVLATGIENVESCFYNRFGQLIYKEPRGKRAGYKYPEVGIHRGRLHLILYKAALARLGEGSVVTDHECVGYDEDETGVTLRFKDGAGRMREPVRADAVIACDGINSAIRKQLYPNDAVAFAGINTWRGVTKRKPILTGRSYMRVGSILTGKIVIYPIIDNVDGEGNQLINWMAEIQQDNLSSKNDWNKQGNLDDFHSIYANWKFDWLDVGEMIKNSEFILEYPMVDKDPIDRWTFGRATLAGDAAHPMYPRGSNGAAQAAIDARTLADCLAAQKDVRAALKDYEAKRAPVAAKIVRTNREHPPDFINIKVEELVGDKPFTNLDDYITQDELRALSDNYKKIAGFALTDVAR